MAAEPDNDGRVARVLESRARRAPDPLRPLTGPEKRLRILFVVHAVISALLACSYVATGATAVVTALPNSFAKDVLFVVLSLLGAADVRRRGWLAPVLAVAYLALVAGQIATLAWGDPPSQDFMLFEVSGTAFLLGWMAADILFAALFVAWWIPAEREGKGLRYLDLIAFAALTAVAEVLIQGEDEVIPPEQVAYNVDGYLDTLQATEKNRVKLALVALGLWPLLTARPPLPAMAPDSRKRFLRRRFLDEDAPRRTFGPLRRLLQPVIRTASQMTYLGYYGDPRTWESIGYLRYKDRDGAQPPPKLPRPLETLPAPPPSDAPDYDVIVIGSGAAGGILAHRFAEAGRRVLVLERGPHVDPGDFTDDEVSQYLLLYNEGALQLSTNFGLQVLQGMCVGGGTSINNGLCVPPPPAVLDEWTAHGIDRAELEAAIRTARGLLDVRPIREDRTTRVARMFAEAVGRLGLPGQLELMEANITHDCRGCGYCNIGCGFAAKQSTLDTTLPWAQRKWPDRLHVLADFEVERITARGGRAEAVEGVHAGGRRAALRADRIVLAAGAISSSLVLQRSGLGGDDVGRGLHFNVNSPLTAEFPTKVDSFDGIQMSHAYVAAGDAPAYLVETWFNPPGTQSLVMPGWFDSHFRNMHRYRHMASAGVLVGTTRPGHVKPSRKGRQFDYDLSPEDRESLLDGLVVAARIFLEAGATHVMPATFTYRRYGPDDLGKMRADLSTSRDLLLTTAHPQGGNAVGRVVGPDFRVAEMENLYLCDASVFPTSVRVNPQLTVMGMAEYAAPRIVSRRREG